MINQINDVKNIRQPYRWCHVISSCQNRPKLLYLEFDNVTDVEVGDGLHLLVFGDHTDDQCVPHQADHHDECEESGHQPGVDQQWWPSSFWTIGLVARRATVWTLIGWWHHHLNLLCMLKKNKMRWSMMFEEIMILILTSVEVLCFCSVCLCSLKQQPLVLFSTGLRWNNCYGAL